MVCWFWIKKKEDEIVSSRNPLASRILFLLLQAVEELETAIVAP